MTSGGNYLLDGFEMVPTDVVMDESMGGIASDMSAGKLEELEAEYQRLLKENIDLAGCLEAVKESLGETDQKLEALRCEVDFDKQDYYKDCDNYTSSSNTLVEYHRRLERMLPIMNHQKKCETDLHKEVTALSEQYKMALKKQDEIITKHNNALRQMEEEIRHAEIEGSREVMLLEAAVRKDQLALDSLNNEMHVKLRVKQELTEICEEWFRQAGSS
uniref:Transforming acidic coiled-coil-containing protein C-terminal domain-containing protein n=1 Tax=Ciona savignyi TaxID=51511 RepID=H2YDM5_CIOSA